MPEIMNKIPEYVQIFHTFNEGQTKHGTEKTGCAKMGMVAAEFVMTRNKVQEAITARMIVRSSL